MDLDTAIEQEAAPRARPCRYCDLLADITDEQADRLGALTAIAASRALAAAGLYVSDHTIGRHRRGGHGRG